MKIAIAAIIVSLSLSLMNAKAEEARMDVGGGPVGAGVTVGESHDCDRDRTTVIKKESEPREQMTIIKKEHDEPSSKVIVKERERN